MKYLIEYLKSFMTIAGWIGGIIMLGSLYLGSPPMLLIYLGSYAAATGGFAGPIRLALED